MAGTGPLPKPQHQRERDTKRRQSDSVTVKADGVVRGPELSGTYSAQTVAWYETWRTSPQALLFEATDWQRLQMLAPLVDSYLRVPSTAALAEIRLNEERLGATYADRQRTRIRIEQTDAEHSADVVSLHIVDRADVKARLRGDTK
jgi:hypothetical protein